MKKEVKIISSLMIGLLLIILLSHLTLAQTTDSPADQIQTSYDQVQNVAANAPQTPEEIAAAGQSALMNALNKSAAGKIVLVIDSGLKAISPAFKLLLGIEYSLSGLFFLCLAIWIAATVLIYGPLNLLFPEKFWVKLGIAIIIPTVAAQFGAIKKLGEFIMPLFTQPWIVITAIIIGTLLLIVYSQVLSRLGKKSKEKQKIEDEERRERKAKKLEELQDIELRSRGIK